MTEAEYLVKASDPATSGAVLEALWREIGSFQFPLGLTVATRIRHAIAKNPNLTQWLAPQCFGQLSVSLAENPALPLLFLENPTLAEQAAEETLLRMTRRPDSPKTLLEILTQHSIRQVREAARLHVAIYGNASEEQVRQELAKLPIGGKDKLLLLHSWKLVPEWLAKVHKLKPRKEPILPAQISGCINEEPLTESERSQIEQLMLAKANSQWETYSDQLREIAEKPYQKSEILYLLSQNHFLRDSLRANPAASIPLLVFLGADKALIDRADAPFEVKASAVARQVEENAVSGLIVVLALASARADEQYHEAALTKRRAVGEELLHEATLSTRWFRRLGAALNSRLAEKDRKRLVEDANAIVRAVARDTKLRDRIMEDEPNGEL